MNAQNKAAQTPTDAPSPHWLGFARSAGLVVAIITLALDVGAIPVMYREAQMVCTTSSCPALLTPAQIAQLHTLGLSLGFYATYYTGLNCFTTLVYAALAALIFWRRPDDRMALFAAFMLVTFGGAAFNGTMHALPLADARWTVPTQVLDAIGQVAFYIFFCIFPSGRFVPRWIRWAALVDAAAWGALLFPDTPAARLALFVTDNVGFVTIIALLVVAQVYRYRTVSTPVERQQTKWVVFGFVAALSGFLGLLVVGNVVSPATRANAVLELLVFNTAVYLLFMLIPVAIVVAILGSRLWDIDVIIRRTLVYGSLTVVLAAVYFGTVLGAQAVVRAFTGQAGQQPVFTVGSTLLIAALFQPVRRRLQSVIDRRFYRRNYDAARTLSAFGTTLRMDTDLAELSAHLVAVVQETMQPAHVSLWLRPPERHSK